MREEPRKPFENVTPEDRERMETLAREAAGVLFAGDVADRMKEQADEEVAAELFKQESEHILKTSAEEEVRLVEQKFDEMFSDPKSLEALFNKFEKDYGWLQSKSWAMVGVLRHALDEVYYRARFRAPDENDPHPEGESRDTVERILTIVSDDYGAEVMREIEPLVRLYVEKGSQLIKESKVPPEDVDNKEVEV